jgi:hypothetical protein
MVLFFYLFCILLQERLCVLASLIGIGLLYFLFRDKEIFNAIFFSFLAAITFPHVLVILKMMHQKIQNHKKRAISSSVFLIYKRDVQQYISTFI